MSHSAIGAKKSFRPVRAECNTPIRRGDNAYTMDVARLRDSTQILLPAGALDGLQADLEERFVLTIRREDEQVRIIGSPTEIKAASAFLTRNGITVA